MAREVAGALGGAGLIVAFDSERPIADHGAEMGCGWAPTRSS
jgi:hypothetical protein